MSNTSVFPLLFILFISLSCNRPENFTKKFSTQATEDEIANFRSSLAKREFSDKSNSECTLQTLNQEYIIKICAHSYYDESNTTAEVSVLTGFASRTILSSQIDLKSYASSDRNIAADIDHDILYIAWISGNSLENQNPSAINLRLVSLTSKKTLFEKIIYQQKWGLQRLAMARHPKANMLLLAYNDFSKKDSEYLYFASLGLDGLEENISIAPQAIHLKDKCEKRFPHFWKSGDRLFLYHSTGDAWGWLSHRGKPSVAISEIDTHGEPQGYTVVADKNTVNNEIRIWNDIVYYEHVIGDNHGEYELKKINLKEIYKPFY